MITNGFFYNRKLKIGKVEKNIKINLHYYQKHILTPIFKEEIPSLYSINLHCIQFHQDKAPRHNSKSTALFFEKKEK